MTAAFPSKLTPTQRRRPRTVNCTNAGTERIWKALNSPAALPSARCLRNLEMRSSQP